MEPAKVCLQFVSLAVLLCSVGIEETTPSDAGTAEANDLLTQASTVEIENTEFKSDLCTLVVCENRKKANSRLIRLPVVRIYSTSEGPAEPVFLLAGGPGLSNIWTTPPKWLLEYYDVVMVGYRGFDGSVSLACSEAVEAAQVENNPLSSENIERLGRALYRGFERLKKEGVDVDGYTIIEVIDDIGCVRRKLGYEKVNLYSFSYGTRLAYLYGLKYPQGIHRSFMYGINPPGGFVWEPDIVESQLRYYSDLWKKNPDCVSKTPDLLIEFFLANGMNRPRERGQRLNI